jgi:hypothetical protein
MNCENVELTFLLTSDGAFSNSLVVSVPPLALVTLLYLSIISLLPSLDPRIAREEQYNGRVTNLMNVEVSS